MINQILFHAPRWTPAELNSEAWFDASDRSTLTLETRPDPYGNGNIDYVSQWRDKSGKNRHATQTVASRQPMYWSSQVASTGSCALVIQNKSNLIRNVAGATIVVVSNDLGITPGLTGETLAAFVSTGSSSTDMRFSFNSDASSSLVSMSIKRLDTPVGVNYTQPLATKQQGIVYIGSYSYQSPAPVIPGSINFWKNGTQVITDLSFIGSGLTANTDPLNAGLFGIDGNPPTKCDPLCNLREVLIFNSTLTTENRQKIEGYVMWKWIGYGLLLPVGHPYRDFPP